MSLELLVEVFVESLGAVGESAVLAGLLLQGGRLVDLYVGVVPLLGPFAWLAPVLASFSL